MPDAWGHNTWELGRFGRVSFAANQDGVAELFVDDERAAREYIDRQIDANPGDRWHPFHTTLGREGRILAAAAPEVREQYRREYERQLRGSYPLPYIHPDTIDRMADTAASLRTPILAPQHAA